MTKNKLPDLNNHLFAQLERLDDEDLTSEQLAMEINRSKAIATVAKNIIDNGNLAMRVMEFRDNRMDADADLPKMLEG